MGAAAVGTMGTPWAAAAMLGSTLATSSGAAWLLVAADAAGEPSAVIVMVALDGALAL